MKLFYYIVAHKEPDLLHRLIKNINIGDVTICIHIDKKQNIMPFKNKIIQSNNVYFIKKRLSINWAGFSQVKVTILGMKEFIKTDADFFIFLSGQDFIIKPLKYLISYLEKNRDKNFIHLTNVQQNWPDAINRINKYYFVDFYKGLKTKFPFFKYLINKIESFGNFIQFYDTRTLPNEYKLFAGSSWFIFNPVGVNHILKTIKAKPNIYKYFKYTLCADELFFHTLIGNSEVLNSVVQNNLRYIKFIENKDNPEILTIQDYEALIASKHYFARKFDTNVDDKILSKLELYINDK